MEPELTKIFLDGKQLEYVLKLSLTLDCDRPGFRALIIQELPQKPAEKITAKVVDIARDGAGLLIHCESFR